MQGNLKEGEILKAERSVSPICFSISARDGGDSAAVSAYVEEKGDLLAFPSPQSGKTTGMAHVAETVAVAEGDTSAQPGSHHAGIHFCSINKTRTTISHG